MQLTHDTLDAKLAEINAQHAQALANLNALAGARQMLEHLKATLDAPEPTAQGKDLEAEAPGEPPKSPA
jgi:hypothetical protein